MKQRFQMEFILYDEVLTFGPVNSLPQSRARKERGHWREVNRTSFGKGIQLQHRWRWCKPSEYHHDIFIQKIIYMKKDSCENPPPAMATGSWYVPLCTAQKSHIHNGIKRVYFYECNGIEFETKCWNIAYGNGVWFWLAEQVWIRCCIHETKRWMGFAFRIHIDKYSELMVGDFIVMSFSSKYNYLVLNVE